jgi:tetratricopeptide (TPR) repeat protein
MRPAIIISSILTALGGIAAAAEPAYPVAAECGPPPESEQARRALAAYWFEQGSAQVDREAFADAERSFGCSQAIIPHPSTLYNLARAADWAGDFDTALKALREYLEAAPDAENRAEAEALAARIAGDIALRDNAAASSSSSPDPVTGSPGRDTDAQDVMGWISVALAGAGAAAGVTLGAFAGYEQGKIDDAPDGVSYGVIAEHESKRDDYLLGMGIGLGVAGAAALAGILLLVLDDDAPVAVAPAPWSDGAGLALVGRF